MDKICTKCKISKSVNDFVLIKKNGKYSSWCRICTNVAAKKSVIKNKEIYKKYAIRYELENPFYRIYKNMKIKHKKFSWGKTVSRAYLKKLWEHQKGKCFWSNFDMEMKVGGRKNPFAVSADRLDNEIGYKEGNIVLCCHWANLGRSECQIDKWIMVLNKLSIYSNFEEKISLIKNLV